jgi:hypothetical protein
MINNFSLGAELEIADIDTRVSLPAGNKYCFKDGSICNSSGVANDPLKQYNIYGSEIQTKPCYSSEELVDEICKIYNCFEKYSFNYTTNLHIHIHVPGLRNNLDDLKKILTYNRKNEKLLFSLIDPIPSYLDIVYAKNAHEYTNSEIQESLNFSKWRQRRRKKSHQHIIPEKLYHNILNSSSIEEFFINFAPKDKNGSPAWGIATRAGINLLQMYRETETIEFRCFNMTDDRTELLSAIELVVNYINNALYNENGSCEEIFLKNTWMKFKKFNSYNYDYDKIFKKTCIHYLPRKNIIENIKELVDSGVVSYKDLHH